MAMSSEEISDRIEIQDLMVRYARAIDTKDYALEAATALEYALLLFLIAGVIIGAVSVFGVSVGDLFKTAGAAIGAVMG